MRIIKVIPVFIFFLFLTIGCWNNKLETSSLDLTSLLLTDVFGAKNNVNHTVTYSGNYNTGGDVPVDVLIYQSGDSVTVLANTGTLVRTAHDFNGWNTRADGLGINRLPGSTFVMGSADVTLYATWTGHFAGGDGTVGNPFQVATATHLNNVRNYLGAYFIQTADIDLNVAPYNSGSGWEPIGNVTTKFLGNYNGNNNTISNLFINRNADSYIGLFGYTDGAVIRNVILDGVNVTGNDYVGGLVGYNTNISLRTASSLANPLIGSCSLSNVNITGNNNVGGLVGYNWGSINPTYPSVIKNCFAIGTITATGNNSGGLVGINVYDGRIYMCFADVTVTGANYTGGITGYTSYGGIVHNSYATGSITGSSYVGGLVGFSESNTGTVTNSYAACLLFHGATNWGGLIGVGGANTVSSYYDATLSGDSDNTKGFPMVTANMLLQATFAGWDFATIWQINGGVSYPYLRWQGGVNIPLP